MPENDRPVVKIRSREDVTEDVLNEVWEYVEGWYLDQAVDWEDVFERFERHTPYDLGSSWDTPAIKKIKRVMREWKREATA